MKKQYAFVNGRCPVSGVPTIERREMTMPDWGLYMDNVHYRREKAKDNKTITETVNQRHNALKTQYTRKYDE
jgi:hypothetical protein